MSQRSRDPEPLPSRLARLPPGRHGLPREFVAQNQRDRLAAGMIASVSRKGYNETTITDVTRAAGVSRRTFYQYFDSKEACFFDTYDLVAEHLRDAAAAAAAEETEWPRKVRAQIAAALDVFAQNPDLVRFALIAPPTAGSEIAARYRLALQQAFAMLTEGSDIPPDEQPSPAVQQALIGGAAALIVRKVKAGAGERMSELLPELVELILTPYLGREEAVQAAQLDAE